MNDNDLKLTEGLRGLAADGPREAPAWIQERLVGELRRRSRVRRRNRRLGVGAAAVAACLGVMLWVRSAPVVPAPSLARVGTALALNKVAATQSPVKPTVLTPTYERGAEVAMNEATLNFYSLPDADDLPPIESATIVRVQLPMSSLRLMGLPVSDDRAAESIQADMLLGQDGLARGVRFVQ
ncbi:MAG TPA: hypothetical protein VGP62_07970 [Bryobacteraceae bacterium]|jgi:hypothetical protein|nr:hypothetical protein [Bryobacteraceae bacterium]